MARKPLAGRSASVVSLEHSDAEFDDSDLDALAEVVRSRRPQVPWARATVTRSVLEVFGPAPASEMALSWLTGELRRQLAVVH